MSHKRRRGNKVRGKKVRAHSRVRLPLEIVTLLPVHNISWSSCAFAIRWATLLSRFRRKIRAIYIISNVHYGSTSPFSPIWTSAWLHPHVRVIPLRRSVRSYRVFSLTWPASMHIFGTKESVCIRKEFNSQRIGLGHQHGRRFIVLWHQ